MIKPRSFNGAAAALLLLVVGAIFVQGQTGAQRTEHVIMISIDGMPPDYYDAPEKFGLKAPIMTSLKRAGAYAEGVEGIYPTVTYPLHTTLVTGLHPAVHGIVQNRIFEAPTDPQTRAWYWYSKDLKTDTLWTLAKKAGLSTAAVGWPVTVGAEIDYNVPEIYEPGTGTQNWGWIAKNSTPGLLDKALGPDGKKNSTVDEKLTSVSEYIIKSHRPNLLLVHLIELDGTHHQYGPRTAQAIETAQREDAFIGRIIEATRQAGIFEKTTFFIVSDHGFAKISQRIAPNVALAKEGLITLDGGGKALSWKAAAWPSSGSCSILLKNPQDKETEAKVISIFTNWAKQPNSPIKKVFTREDLRRLGTTPQAVIMLEAAPGYTFDEALTGPEIRASGEAYKGTHGFLPTNPEMHSSLIVYGAGARNGAKMTLARMVDIAPTVATLLNLKLTQTEGKPLKNLIKQ
jgi:predicted AlkP superfamily pyrophosphatase or phosphodiesterase